MLVVALAIMKLDEYNSFDKFMVWFGIVFFGGGVVLFGINAFTECFVLKIDDKGFVDWTCFHGEEVHWKNVENIRVVSRNAVPEKGISENTLILVKVKNLRKMYYHISKNNRKILVHNMQNFGVAVVIDLKKNRKEVYEIGELMKEYYKFYTK